MRQHAYETYTPIPTDARRHLGRYKFKPAPSPTHPPHTGHSPRTSSWTTHLSPSLSAMDKMIEAVAAHLCRHRSVGLLRPTLDLTRRRLDLIAEIGAVEVVRGAVAPPTPGTETWWRAVASAKNGAPPSPFFPLSSLRDAEERRLVSPQRRRNECKAALQTDRRTYKKYSEKLKNPQELQTRAVESQAGLKHKPTKN